MLYRQLKQRYDSLRGGKFRRRLIDFLQNRKDLSPEESEILQFVLKSETMTVFPYDYCRKYNRKDIDIRYDKAKKLYYTVLFGDKRLYFKRKMTEKSCAEYINSILCEQDNLSPHCYLSDDFEVRPGGSIVDAGAAEGYFALRLIDSAKKVYLFEPDAEWRVALEATFAPWKEKTEIVPKFVDEKSGATTVSLDDFFAGRDCPDFIKADVEGFEKPLLLGASRLISESDSLSLALCTYHKQGDFEDLSAILSKHGFSIRSSRGYMFLYTDRNLDVPYLRRGILRAERCI
jgi:hypothetical protein